jgi:hypothetical protein
VSQMQPQVWADGRFYWDGQAWKPIFPAGRVACDKRLSWPTRRSLGGSRGSSQRRTSPARPAGEDIPRPNRVEIWMVRDHFFAPKAAPSPAANGTMHGFGMV